MSGMSASAQEALQNAMSVANDVEASQVEPIHLLKAMLDASENNLKAIVKRIGADYDALVADVDAAVEAKPKVQGASFMGMRTLVSGYMSTISSGIPLLSLPNSRKQPSG